MLPSRQEILSRASQLPSRPAAIQALWDGDTSGWFLVLSAVIRDGNGWRDHCLWALRDTGGDMRIFSGEVPPWPESQLAIDVGEELAQRFGIPFYFPSPEHPETCPDWWEQAEGSACQQCGVILSRNYNGTVRVLCTSCSTEKERREKESHWTELEKAGPRCHMCGNPATPPSRSPCEKCKQTHCMRPECGTFCSDCHHYHCGKCDRGMSDSGRVEAKDFDSTPCVFCRSIGWLERLSDSDCQSIHALFQSYSSLEALLKMATILEVSFDDLHIVQHEIENGIAARLKDQ